MTRNHSQITVKRIYEDPEPGDGDRILVDRLWPRGIAKESAAFDEWCKEVAPSTELRKFYGHRPERWQEFEKRYRAELAGDAATTVRELAERSRRHHLTLLTATRDVEHSAATTLAEHLRRVAGQLHASR